MVASTPSQKSFILDRFFKRLDIINWKEIATELLDKGQCTVGGSEHLWKGGIENFIEVIHNDGAFDVMLYKLDLKGLLASDWFQDSLLAYIQDASEQLMNESIRINELTTMLG